MNTLDPVSIVSNYRFNEHVTSEFPKLKNMKLRKFLGNAATVTKNV